MDTLQCKLYYRLCVCVCSGGKRKGEIDENQGERMTLDGGQQKAAPFDNKATSGKFGIGKTYNYIYIYTQYNIRCVAHACCFEHVLALLLDFIICHSITYMHAYGYYCYALIYM